MKLGIMQPYFLPYIGYWQLLNAVDKYVIYDDVNYINRGWINRNRILINGKPAYFNIPMRKASQNKLINEIEINHDKKIFSRLLRTIELSYKKAPYYSSVYPLIRELFECEQPYLSGFIANSITQICSYLNIHTELYMSSLIEKNHTLKGQDKILDICTRMKASEYYNAIGGRKLYDCDEFQKKGISLKFLKTNSFSYTQFGNEFQDNLSILDIMMFNSVNDIKKMLEEYILITDDNVPEDIE